MTGACAAIFAWHVLHPPPSRRQAWQITLIVILVALSFPAFMVGVFRYLRGRRDQADLVRWATHGGGHIWRPGPWPTLLLWRSCLRREGEVV